MSGSESSRKLEALERHLAEVELRLGLSEPRSVQSGAFVYLEMDSDNLARMTDSEANRAAILLSGAAFHVQRTLSRALALRGWANRRIDRMLAREIPAQRAYSREERRALAIRASDEATRLDQIASRAELIIDDLSYLPSALRDCADKFAQWAHAKRVR